MHHGWEFYGQGCSKGPWKIFTFNSTCKRFYIIALHIFKFKICFNFSSKKDIALPGISSTRVPVGLLGIEQAIDWRVFKEGISLNHVQYLRHSRFIKKEMTRVAEVEV